MLNLLPALLLLLMRGPMGPDACLGNAEAQLLRWAMASHTREFQEAGGPGNIVCFVGHAKTSSAPLANAADSTERELPARIVVPAQSGSCCPGFARNARSRDGPCA